VAQIELEMVLAPIDQTPREPDGDRPTADRSGVSGPDGSRSTAPNPEFADARPRQAVTSFGRWADTVLAADEPCLVIDYDLAVVAASTSCCALLGLDDPNKAAGLTLLDAGLILVDFTASRGELTDAEVDKIPPILAVTSGRQARGLLRVQRLNDGGETTVDAMATPLRIDGVVAGSLTFFAPI